MKVTVKAHKRKGRAVRTHARSKTTGKKKIPIVLREFKKGTLKSSSGQQVTDRKQALAIALSEAGLSKKKKTKK